MSKAWIGVLVGALMLAGCGDDSDEAEDADPIPAPAVQTTQGGVVSHDHGPGAATPGCPDPSTSLRIVATNATFNTDCLAGTADQPLTLSYENKDQINHNIVLVESHTATEVMFRADYFTGPKTQSFTVPPQKAGTYAFHCEAHPNVMKGTFMVA
ncbi:MAG: cupredoxin domain-containing protein [Actinobacteria bacterium]|nr:cupredoxin domain-containing protein [Actinomycetota bacterium]